MSVSPAEARTFGPPALRRVRPAVASCPGRRFKRSLRPRRSRSAGLRSFCPLQANVGSAVRPGGLGADVCFPQTFSSACFLPFSFSFAYFLPFFLLYQRRRSYAAATLAHNEPLFWLHVVERSLVRHVSPTPKSHPASSIPFYRPCVPSLQLPALFPARRSWKSFPS